MFIHITYDYLLEIRWKSLEKHLQRGKKFSFKFWGWQRSREAGIRSRSSLSNQSSPFSPSAPVLSANRRNDIYRDRKQMGGLTRAARRVGEMSDC